MFQIDHLIRFIPEDAASLRYFTERLFSAAPSEDLGGYSVEDLFVLAQRSFDFFSERQSGRPKVGILDLSPPFDTQGELSVLCIANDDMPFLVDSIIAFLTELGHSISLVLHPVLPVKRDSQGRIDRLFREEDGDLEEGLRESFIQVYVRRFSNSEQSEACIKGIYSLLHDIRITVLDWQSMQARLRQAILSYRNDPPPVPVEELTESIAFLEWLLANHFTFLGVREYAFEGGAETGDLVCLEDKGLGILRDPELNVLKIGEEAVTITPEIRTFLMQPAPLIITKSDVRSKVHRRVQMDYVGVKQFNKQGDLVGELQIVGLFTSTTYTRSPRDIPLVRRKIEGVLAKSRLDLSGHSGKGLLNVLENFPRDELFQIDVATLSRMSLDIMRLSERPRIKVFVRKDKFDRFVSVYVFLFKNHFNADVAAKISQFLGHAFGGTVESSEPSFGEHAMVRVHSIISRGGISGLDPNLDDLEEGIRTIVRTFDDRVTEVMSQKLPPAEVRALEERFHGAFPPGYADTVSPQEAFESIEHIKSLNEGAIGVDFSQKPMGSSETFCLKLYRFFSAIPLSDRLPILENMGFKAIEENTFTLFPKKEGKRVPVFLHEIILTSSYDWGIDLAAHKTRLEETFLAVWSGLADNDLYNTLVLGASLSWRQVSVLRACGRYLRQAGIPFSNHYVAQTLVTHRDIARLLVDLFYVRFDPAFPGQPSDRLVQQNTFIKQIEQALQAVLSLDEDRILRRFLSLILAMLRVNFFQKTELSHSVLSFKFASRTLEDLPEPRPFAEIFVYSPEVEGVHLRSGPIARGGLRWSDRPEDFRTEVLGLVKAQMVKNAVIVAVGAKGGFVPKALPAAGTREEIFAEGLRAYKIFVSSLLGLTDNLIEGGRVLSPPSEVICYDGEDPYLVVAADKGTATFSDTANALSADHSFWLDDAFASGGSQGYDHKKMGITARGAWEAVSRHFREKDISIDITPFRVVGVGDMSGDVFGNGMLLSKAIRLVAAFDHRDIFLDPNPDCAQSFAERERLFNLPRSSWQDYNRACLSPGGGVFSRSLKSIPLSPEVKTLLGFSHDHAPPSEVIRAILKMRVDLLWLGGIGTYIKSKTETDFDVGDRTNDAIRISADEVGASVIGEGANLGITQRGRIDFALRGGAINTDAVDNSAGVNSSDIEVNIKIATRAAEMQGSLQREDRNRLLADMTPDVASAVLQNNIRQTLCLTLAHARGMEDFGFNVDLIHMLEARGGLNRAIEFLPEDGTLLEREARGQAFCRPELAVLMAYAKLVLFEDIVKSSLPDDPYFEDELLSYFPKPLVAKHLKEITEHRLRREIIATRLANHMVNHTGPSFINRLAQETGLGIEEITRAFALANHVFGFEKLNAMVEALNGQVAHAVQLEMFLEAQTLLRRVIIWFLRNRDKGEGLDALGEKYAKGMEDLRQQLPEVLPETALQRVRDRQTALIASGVPQETAQAWSLLRYLQRGTDIIHVSLARGLPVREVARLFFRIGSQLAMDRLVAQGMQIATQDFHERMAINRTIDGILQTHRAIVLRILESAHPEQEEESIRQTVLRTRTLVDTLLSGKGFSLAHLVIVSREYSDLARSS